jgi:hypothetical protein
MVHLLSLRLEAIRAVNEIQLLVRVITDKSNSQTA